MMKTLTILALWLIGAGCASAQFTVPKSVKTVSELEAAKAEAKAKGKPLGIMFSSEKTKCPYTTEGSEATMREFRMKTVLVYVDYETVKQLPAPVQKEFEAIKGGLPEFIAYDAALSKPIATVAHTRDVKEREKRFREAGKQIAAAKPGAATGGSALDSLKR